MRFDAGWRCARLGHPPQVRLGVATGHSATIAAPAEKRRQPTSASVAARLPRPTPSGRSPALLNNLGGAHQHPPGPTHPRAASVIPSPPFTAAAAADRATPSEGAALTSKPFLHDVGPMLRRMSVVEQKTSTAGGNSTPMLGCRWENSTVRSRRSRRIKRLERRLAAAFSADGPGEYDPISKARFGAST